MGSAAANAFVEKASGKRKKLQRKSSKNLIR
jgi:hypothetical protein